MLRVSCFLLLEASLVYLELQNQLIKRYGETVETLMVDWVRNIVIHDTGDLLVNKLPLPLRYDFHTGSVSTGATQDLLNYLQH